MAKMVTLQMDIGTLDVLNIAIEAMRGDVKNGRWSMDDAVVADTLVELEQLEYLLTKAYEDLDDAK